MTLDDLKTGLGILKPGQMLSMSYAVYELIFPPGEPDELARTRAWACAEEYGCAIKNLPSEKRVLFLKPKPPTKTKSNVKWLGGYATSDCHFKGSGRERPGSLG